MSSTAVVLLAILAAVVVPAVVDRSRRGRARPGTDGPESGPPVR